MRITDEGRLLWGVPNEVMFEVCDSFDVKIKNGG